MSRFWKFNSLVGSLGLILLIVAYFTGVHYETMTEPPNFSILWSLTKQSAYFLMVSAGCFAWQLIMTFLGILVGFFRAPSNR
jgi:formate hydrogenlyase subunit 3/multisubunit Na+/H+ antiporter MnhD subunit